ncbi:MAG: hypothetical protein QOH49_92 [Acidobacteriota bacterium]|jgi:hypothetical protein|nr:hypothetical protein [Acidobacteriota bacterium]
MESSRLTHAQANGAPSVSEARKARASTPPHGPLGLDAVRPPALTLGQSPGPARVLQKKLAISQPGNADELEADRVAERVMRMPDTTVRLQRKCACGGGCESCAGEKLRIQRRASGEAASGAPAPASVGGVLSEPGSPLDQGARSFMESRFGHDFGHVRVHADARAATSAREVGALAYTVGRDIVFGSGEYAPGTSGGRQLLAHELTHVVQQSHGGTQVQRQQPGAAGQQPSQPQQQQPNLLKIYSFGPTGAGRYAHDEGTTIFPPAAPVDAQGNELVRAGTTAQPILSRLGRYFTVDERRRPLTPPVPDSRIKVEATWQADDGSHSWRTFHEDTGTYYGPGEPLGSRLGTEYIFRNDRPGVLYFGYILDNATAPLFLVLTHTMHYVNNPAASTGATVIDRTPDSSSAP